MVAVVVWFDFASFVFAGEKLLVCLIMFAFHLCFYDEVKKMPQLEERVCQKKTLAQRWRRQMKKVDWLHL